MRKNLLFILLLSFMTGCITYLEVATINYDNGQVKTTGKHFSDYEGPMLRIGIWRKYYPNGQLKSQGEYGKDYRFARCPQNVPLYYNYKTGPWVYYFQNGNIKAEGVYQEVMINGEFRQHKFGIIDSSWKFYDATGVEANPEEYELQEYQMTPYDDEINCPQIFMVFNEAKQNIEIEYFNNNCPQHKINARR
jgi:antitoxin component YwqK of YwqJK toxin-antitoxin module